MKPYYEDPSGIVIYHGDCREILPGLPKVDLVLTDPPYGIGFAAQPTNYQRAKGMKPEAWDNSVVDFLPLILPRGAVQIIWGGNYYSLPTSRGWLCWYKPDAPPSMGNFELAWTNQDRNPRLVVQTISATNPERVGHPTQKPLAVMLFCLEQFPNAQTVLDPFAGSGTTLVACKRLGRKAIGIEIEEKYCEIAARRLQEASMPLLEALEPKQEMLLEWNAAIDRCDQEIAAIDERPDVETSPAYLSTMGRNDWEHEKRLIRGER